MVLFDGSEFECEIVFDVLVNILGVVLIFVEVKIYLWECLDVFLNGVVLGKMDFDDWILIWVWNDDEGVKVFV